MTSSRSLMSSRAFFLRYFHSLAVCYSENSNVLTYLGIFFLASVYTSFLISEIFKKTYHIWDDHNFNSTLSEFIIPIFLSLTFSLLSNDRNSLLDLCIIFSVFLHYKLNVPCILLKKDISSSGRFSIFIGST